jgi:epoxyqueuosine reductase
MIASHALALEQRIKAQAFGLGFDLAGIATLGEPDTAAHFDAWLAAGYDGEMAYLARGAEKRRDARRPVGGARSAIVVALEYGGRTPSGPIARYARSDDYHDVMVARLRELHRWLESETGASVPGKAYVDTGPILERDLARRAGLGWFGKNTTLINPTRGSHFFLGSLLVAMDLEPDAPFEADRCGTCTRCLEACPTQAIRAPRVLDATRCISYLTIELKGAIPLALREPMGELIYGCDICQDVCPWNERFAAQAAPAALAPRPEIESLDARTALALDDAQFRTRLKGSPMKRTRRRGLARNAAVALGNRRDPGDVPALVTALADEEALVRGHAAWALGQIGTPQALDALRARAMIESDASAREELRAALGPSPEQLGDQPAE